MKAKADVEASPQSCGLCCYPERFIWTLTLSQRLEAWNHSSAFFFGSSTGVPMVGIFTAI